jgi:hypothetical protein
MTTTFSAHFLSNVSDFTVDSPSSIDEIKTKLDEWLP